MRLLLVLLASLFLAAPAMAQDPGTVGAPDTVGPGQVVTDPASETENDATDVPYADDGQPAPEPAPDASGRRGEVHVLDSVSSSSTPAPAAAPTAAAAPAPAAVPVSAAASRNGTRAKPAELPFTGVDAWALALIGAALLAAGSGLLAVLRQPVK